MTDMIAALRKEKQKQYNDAVNGYGRQPTEVVDSVVYAIKPFLPVNIQDALWAEVLNFYPDYEDTDNDDD